MRLTCMTSVVSLLLCACAADEPEGDPDTGANSGMTDDGSETTSGPGDDGNQTGSGTTTDGLSTTGGEDDDTTTFGEDWNTDDGSPTTTGEGADCELGSGPDLVVAVNYDSPEAKKNDYFAFSDLPCVAGSPASQLSCETAPGVMEVFGVVAGVVDEAPAYPWATGDSLRLSTNYVGEDMGIRAYDTFVAVRSPDGQLLLAAAGDGITASAAPLEVSTEIACALDEDNVLLRVTYEMEGEIAELVGYGTATLETPSGTYEILQEAGYTLLDSGNGEYLTAVVVRTGD